jgi:CTP:molybdopterin cytidylyltransferase MocA
MKYAHEEYTVEQLQQAFTSVQNSEHWKNPISATINKGDQALVHEAIVYFAGCNPQFEPIMGTELLTVKAVGYYVAVGA